MNCERYQRLLHLHREGETTEEEAREIRLHVRQCQRCALELQRIERADGFIERLRVSAPGPVDPERLTADIMRRVRSEPSNSRPVHQIDRILDYFLLPSVRYSAIAVVLIVTATFMIQVGGTLTGISDLEEYLASPHHGNGPVSMYSVQSKTLRDLATSERAKPLLDNIALTVTGNRIDIPVKDADALLSGSTLTTLPALIGTSAFGIDKKTLEIIVHEVRATAEMTFRIRHQGA